MHAQWIKNQHSLHIQKVMQWLAEILNIISNILADRFILRVDVEQLHLPARLHTPNGGEKN